MTYDKVAVEIKKGFTRALLYVALSRARDLDGLFLFGETNSIVSERILKMTPQSEQKTIDALNRRDPA